MDIYNFKNTSLLTVPSYVWIENVIQCKKIIKPNVHP